LHEAVHDPCDDCADDRPGEATPDNVEHALHRQIDRHCKLPSVRHVREAQHCNLVTDVSVKSVRRLVRKAKPERKPDYTST
jgi:hypothetical protein